MFAAELSSPPAHSQRGKTSVAGLRIRIAAGKGALQGNKTAVAVDRELLIGD